MKNVCKIISGCLLTFLWVACDKQNDDLVKPLTESLFPQVITFADEGDGDLEDEDKFSMALTLIDRVDPEGNELGGKVVPLNQAATVSFEVSDFEGFAQISDYIKGVSAFYEVDDCNTEDVDVTFNTTTGLGTVAFPAGVEEVEIEFEVDESLFDDDELNTDDRTITFMITGVTGGGNVTFNAAAEFKYEVLDDEGIHGEWSLDIADADLFAKFKSLFGLISEEVRDLEADDIDEILFLVEYDEVKIEIVLKETETVTECGETEVENIVIEIEGGIEELDIQSLSGAIEFAEEIEQNDGTLKEFVYAGSFNIVGKVLTLVLEGEYDDDSTDEITLILSK